MINYRSNYIKIYFWKAISIFLGFISLFVVVPYLSSDKTLYGIYSVCTSLTIFFSYADLGFLSSGAKFAAEYYIKGDYKNEIKVIGFTAFIMSMVFLVMELVILWMSVSPQHLIPELVLGSDNFIIARKLMLLLALGCPFMIGQRVLEIIYMIRVEEYKYQRILIVASLLRILSVFFFFGTNRYDIVGYYGFYQIVNFLILLIAWFDIRKYGFRASDFIKSFKFDKIVFEREKALSMSSLILMLSMMVYNEFDQIVISNKFGVEAVSIYAIAFSIMTYARTYSGLVYSPFLSRFNHFTGLGDYLGLINFTKKIILVFSPILIIPLLNIALYADAFIVSWVGEEYLPSAFMVGWMIMSYAVSSIKTPLSSYMTAMEKNRKITYGAVMLPILYWGGILLLSNQLGYRSFAIMKFLAPTLLIFYYWKIIKYDVENLNTRFISFKELFTSTGPAIIVSIALSFLFRPLLCYSHSFQALIHNIFVILACILISIGFELLFNKGLRDTFRSNLKIISVKRTNDNTA